MIYIIFYFLVFAVYIIKKLIIMEDHGKSVWLEDDEYGWLPGINI